MKDKEALEKADAVFRGEMKRAMDKRVNEWNAKKQEFLILQMNRLKERIIRTA